MQKQIYAKKFSIDDFQLICVASEFCNFFDIQ